MGKSGLFLAGKTGADEPRGVQLRSLADPPAGESGDWWAYCAERERRYRGGKLAGSPESERCFRLGFHPSFAYQRLLSPQFNSDYLPELNVFIFIGEVLNKALVKQLRRRFPQAKILNSYGPTEATIATTVVEITDEILNNDNPLLPVGVMMPDTHMEITADGELIIWGKNVMRGYLGLPQENATKLLRRESEEYRGYRTGDLGYEDGLIYCGAATIARSN